MWNGWKETLWGGLVVLKDEKFVKKVYGKESEGHRILERMADFMMIK